MAKFINMALLEGEKEAAAYAAIEGLPGVNPQLREYYPVDVASRPRNIFQAISKFIKLGRCGIYSRIVRK